MAREKLSGIYCIRNTVNDKRYIGQSRNIRKRWNDHQRDLRRGMHANRMLQSAYNKYGAGVFVYEVLCECGCEALNENEIRLIALYDAFGDNGYNLTSGGDGYGDLNVTKDNASKRKSVVCFNTGRQYNSIKEAAADYGISPSSVRLCCVHKCRRGGYIPNTKTPLVWFFREEYDALTDEQRAEIVDYVENSQDRRYMKSVLEAHERKVVCLNDGSAYISIKKQPNKRGCAKALFASVVAVNLSAEAGMRLLANT